MIWKSEKLGAAGTWLSGGTPSKKESALWAGDIPWVSPKDMKRLRIRDAIDHVSVAALENGTQLAPIGSLLMVVRGMILAHTFPAALVQHPVAFNQDIKALVPSASFDSEFLLSWLQSKAQDVLRLVDVANHGTKRLPSERLFDLDLVCPPLPEQRKIAAILSSMDDTIEASRTVIDQLQVVKKALMAELLTSGLPGRHKNFKQTEIGEVPEDWQVAAIAGVGAVDAGKARDPKAKGTLRPYLRVANVFDGEIRIGDVLEMPFTDAEFERFALRSGDVLLNEGQSIELVGRCSLYKNELGRPCAIQNALLRFRSTGPVRAEFAEQYFRWCQYSGRFAEVATQTTSIAHLGLKRFASLRMPVPPRGEQEEIAGILMVMDQRLRAEETAKRAVVGAKSALMSVLLTGEVLVCADDQNT
jgi:type I restriction enzyme S subunit